MTASGRTARGSLTRERIVAEAIRLADTEGLARLSMRRLGDSLGVEAMSLYHHFPNKAALLDGMVDAVFAEIDPPSAVGPDWREGLRAHAISKRAALRRHHWALGVLDSRTTPGLVTLDHHDAVLGMLRASGFGVREAGHAYAFLDSYIFGFVNQEAALPVSAGTTEELAASILSLHDAQLPHLAEYAERVIAPGGYDFADEFDVGLDLALDALATLRHEAPHPTEPP